MIHNICFLDDRGITPIFESLNEVTGKYISSDEHCLLVHLNNCSLRSSMNCEVLISRFTECEFENKLGEASMKSPNT